MVEQIKKSKILILLLLTGAVYFFLKYISPLVAPVLVAMLFVTIFGPMFKKMQRRMHIHRQIGAICLLLFAGIILAAIVWILFSWIVSSLPQWIENLDIWEKEITVFVGNACETIGRTFGIDSVYLENTLLHSIQEGIDYVQMNAVPDMLSYSWEYAKLLTAFGGFLVTFIIAAVLLAKDYDEIMNRMLDREECHMTLEVICGIIRYIATFVKAQAIIMMVIAGTCAVTLGISRLQHGVLWGILAGILDVLPFIGTGVVLLPMAAVQLFYGSYGKAVTCVFLYIVCIFLREILEPRLIGRKIGVSPIAVLVSLYAGIRLFGVWGIVKGPLGFIIIYQTYLSLQRRREKQQDGKEQDGKEKNTQTVERGEWL